MPRDKFAALSSRAAESNSTGDVEPSTAAPSASAPAQPPGPDKLAASAASAPPATSSGASLGGRGNKFAAMAARGAAASTPEIPPKSVEEAAREEHFAKVKERLSKRKSILESLDRAEDLTCKLLEIAHQTTTALQDLSGSPSISELKPSPNTSELKSPDISELSKTYRQTLQELYPLLSTDTQELIQPYKNHSQETQKSMYAARVEMRLARERTEVLKAFTELERNERAGQTEPTAMNNKRPREEETTVVS
jgi:hypothetical protein